MYPPFTRRRMALTSLIDVIFLLLLFFMLSSTFSTFGEIELGQATAGVTKSSAVSNPAFVQLGVDRLVLNGNATTFERLVAEIKVDQLLISLDQDTSRATTCRFVGSIAGSYRPISYRSGVTK